MNNSVNVSVIIPVYNSERWLLRCVKSVMNQSMHEIEIILVDDGSSDNSGKICDQIASEDDRINVIHQSNAGAGVARNAGLMIASGEYIGFVDSDDWIESEMFETMYLQAKDNNLDIVRCNSILHENGNETELWTPDNSVVLCDKKKIQGTIVPLLIAPENEGEYFKRLGRGCCCCLFRKKMLDDNKVWFRDIRHGQDAIFTMEAMWKADIMVLLPNAFYHYMKQEYASLSISMNKYRNYDQRNESRKIIDEMIKGSEFYPIFLSRWEQEDRRFVYMDARIATVYNNKANRREKIKLLKELVNSKESIEAFSKPIKDKLPFQLYLLYFMIRNKMYRSLYFAIEYKFRQNKR